jgi:hypothetical protein
VSRAREAGTVYSASGRGAIAQLGERLNGMQAPLSAVASRSPITIDTSGIAQVIVCGGEAITTLEPITEAAEAGYRLRDPVHEGQAARRAYWTPAVTRSTYSTTRI